MALGIQTSSGSGDVRPYITYDAKAGRAFRIDRRQGSDGMWSSDKVDISRDLTFIADFASIRVGWIHYTQQGPIKRLATLGKEAIPARPADVTSDGKLAFKQGFELTILLSNACGGGPAREFSSTAGCVIEAVDALHDAYMAAPESGQGKLPVVKMLDAVPVKSGQSTNYKPVLQIIAWKDRPGELPIADATPSAPAPTAATPPATGSTVVAPPVQATQPVAPAPQPATVPGGADDFG